MTNAEGLGNECADLTANPDTGNNTHKDEDEGMEQV